MNERAWGRSSIIPFERHWAEGADEPSWWESRWGNATLVRLGTWAVRRGTDPLIADQLLEAIWCLYSFSVYPILGEFVTTGLIVSMRGPITYVSILIPSEARRGTIALQRVEETLTRQFPELGDLSIEADSEWMSTDRIRKKLLMINENPSANEFASMYDDVPRQDLAVVLDSSDFETWLLVPNILLGGATPASVLNDPTDVRLRELILSVRHGMYL